MNENTNVYVNDKYFLFLNKLLSVANSLSLKCIIRRKRFSKSL